MTRLLLACGATRLDRRRASGVVEDLRRLAGDVSIELLPLAGTDADRSSAVEALRDAVRSGRADAAVMAWADLPFDRPEGLRLAAVPLRADPRDALLERSGRVLSYLPEGARVGAVELRQVAQILRRRGDLVARQVAATTVEAVERFDQGDDDALIVRLADLDWLGWSDRVTEFFDTDQMIPAPGQGALALEARADDRAGLALLARLHDPDTAYAVQAERVCAARLGAEAGAPVGVHAITDGTTMFIHGIVATADGSRAARLRWSGPSRSAEEVGDTLAELLESVGARAILSGGDLPPSIRYAERRRQLIEGFLEDPDEPSGPPSGTA